MYPESNVPDVYEYFIARKRAGYLIFDTRIVNGYEVVNDVPGFDTERGGIKDELFKGYAGYIKLHGMREHHIEILQDAISIKGVEEMTKYDRFTAVMGCLKGVGTKFIKRKTRLNQPTKKYNFRDIYGN